jgi:REP-associated tyrosine transposase
LGLPKDMSQKYIREKKHRLDPEIYVGEEVVSFTVCIRNRNIFFTNNELFKIFENYLLNELRIFDCSAYVYLFMPDHLHLVLTGNDSKANIKKCLEMFKQKTGFWLSNNIKKIKWQKDYYDHILRSEENLIVHIKYILNNPVRAGLVEYWKQYQYKGSAIYNLDEWE